MFCDFLSENSNIIYLLIGTFHLLLGTIIGYWLSLRKLKKAKSHELKIKYATKFITISHDSLQHISSDLNIEKANTVKFELIKLSEVLKLLFNEDVYEKAKKFVDDFSVRIRFLNNERANGFESKNKTEVSDFVKQLDTLSNALKKSI